MATFRRSLSGRKSPAPRQVFETFQTLDFQGRMVAVIAYKIPNPEPPPPEDSEDWEYWSSTILRYATAVGNRPVRKATHAEWSAALGSQHVWELDWLMFIEDDDTPLVRRNMGTPMY